MNQQNLAVTIIQTSLFWEQPEKNRAHFASLFEDSTEASDLIVLPEMFTTGFTMNPQPFAEDAQGETLQWMQHWAKEKDAAITGSIIYTENENYYNRLFFVFPDGNYATYDKKHTFTLAGEHKVYKAGTTRTVINYKGWKLCPLICYDLRFPVWARHQNDYDVLLFVANWPHKRVHAWDTLLQARAIENMSYCVGVNRVGKDGNGHLYTGHSAIYDMLGKPLQKSINDKEAFVETIFLSKNDLETTRNQLKFLQDRDSFTLG